MSQINQYPNEQTTLDNEDLFDIDAFSVGPNYESKRVKWGTIKTQTQNLANTDLTQTDIERNYDVDGNSLKFNNADSIFFNFNNVGSLNHNINNGNAPFFGRVLAQEQQNGNINKFAFQDGSRAYRAWNNGTFWFGDDSGLGAWSGYPNLQPNKVFHATFISADKKTCFTDIAVPPLPTTDPEDSIVWFRSQSKGVLFPNLTTLQRNGIPTPREGLVIYNVDTNKLQVYDGSVGTGWSNMN